ncbi:MAG: beta-ketoacyl-ACP synthase [Gammaproteobacteria bacterium]|nr:beta-ketoacyl-ACP synthase [Gammaproteobacteria bacterium]
MEIQIIDYESTTAAGKNMASLRTAIVNQRSGLRANNFPGCDLDTWIGYIPEVDEVDLGPWQSRNNALAALGLQQGNIMATIKQLMTRYSASRIGIAIGSSTASIDRTEKAYTDLDKDGRLKTEYRQAKIHNPHAPSLFVAHYTGITGPAITINTACSSSAKVFATASRWLQCGIVDAVLVGGVDSLCLSVLYGFDSLQLLSPQACRPFDQNRDGINLGEGSGYAILARPDINTDSKVDIDNTGICLSGYGESSDAYHMSHPHPEGLGARYAIEQALTQAKLTPGQIDYINLHGTASRANDLIEGKLIANIFAKQTPCSSTKGLMGHTLGAAGITEALITIDAMRHNVIPASKNLAQLDKQLDVSISSTNLHSELNHVMSNSFGFGGNNCCLIFSKKTNKT